ncbi:MAG: four helix bundle protein [bacterium]|nr:MAG: four helix bundle protein [bacterium]
MKTYRDCNLWKKSRSLLFSVYRITEHFPAEKKSCIGNQLQNYCITNLSNIVKCCNRKRNGRGKLLKNSMCVMDKLESCLQHAFGLHLLNENDFHYLSQEMAEIRMLITRSNVKSGT